MRDSTDYLQLLAGTRLFSQGDQGDYAYLIQSGQIEIFTQQDGQDYVVARRGVGDIIGEMALIDGRARSASARVVVDTVLVPISVQQFEHRMADTDPILRMCLGVVIERLRDTLTLVQRNVDVVPMTQEGDRAVGADFNAAIETLTLEREIQRALRDGEFELYLQPIVHLETGGLHGFEALTRWNHPRRGIVLPNDFIAAAEQSGLIVGITEWCLHEVTRIFPAIAAAALRNRAHVRNRLALDSDLFICVNVSGHDLVKPAFAETVRSILADAGVPPRNVKLEVTESMLMKDPQGARTILEACRKRGMGIAVDDFGTGYSSLSYLSTLPITTIKIDRGFVRDIATDPTSRKIVSTIRHLARELEIAVVAEGIETKAQADILTAMGCEFGQGYLYARPLPLPAALDLVRAWPLATGECTGQSAPVSALQCA